MNFIKKNLNKILKFAAFLLIFLTFLVFLLKDCENEEKSSEILDNLYKFCEDGSSFDFESQKHGQISVVCLKKEEFYSNYKKI